MRILIAVFSMMVMALTAKKKGFNPWFWFLTAGIPCFFILIFTPSANNNLSKETQLTRRKRGDVLGATLSVISVFISIEVLALFYGHKDLMDGSKAVAGMIIVIDFIMAMIAMSYFDRIDDLKEPGSMSIGNNRGPTIRHKPSIQQ